MRFPYVRRHLLRTPLVLKEPLGFVVLTEQMSMVCPHGLDARRMTKPGLFVASRILSVFGGAVCKDMVGGDVGSFT